MVHRTFGAQTPDRKERIMDKLPADRRHPGSPARASAKITLSMDELGASLDSFLVEPEAARRGHVIAAEETASGVTCNFKCGPTAYWECGETSVAQGCDTVATCWSCLCTGPGYDTGC
jgi:hypothetical protein